MNPMLKKIVGALAVKEAVDRIQSASQPKRSFLRRNFGKLVLLALGGGALYMYRSGKAQPLIDKVQGGSDSSSSYQAPTYAGPPTTPSTSPAGDTLTVEDRPLETPRV